MAQNVEEDDVPDISRFVSLLEELKTKSTEVKDHVRGLKSKFMVDGVSTDDGISLLDLKSQLFMNYLINLCLVMLKKMNGELIEGSPPVDRLIEIRVILEKLRPLDQKLRYQIDKVLRRAALGGPDASDPLQFKPNPNNLVSKLDEDSGSEESDEEDDGRKRKADIYVPPRVTAVPYEEEPSKAEKQKQRRAAQRVLKGSLLQELREEYSETPQELSVSVSGLRRKQELHREQEQEQFEEDNFLRLPKKTKGKLNGRGTSSAFQEITDFGGLSDFIGETPNIKSKKSAKFKKHRHSNSKKNMKRR